MPDPTFSTTVPVVPGTYWDGCKLYDLKDGLWWREGRWVSELHMPTGSWFYGPLPTEMPKPPEECGEDCQYCRNNPALDL